VKARKPIKVTVRRVRPKRKPVYKKGSKENNPGQIVDYYA